MAKWQQRRSFWTWGYASDEPTEAQRRAAAERVSQRLGHPVEPAPIPEIAQIALRSPRLQVPAALQAWTSTSQAERVVHTYGGHPLELLRAIRGDFANPPDAVAHPRTEDELEATLEWCDKAGHAAIPFGGGTSVVWGVSVPAGDRPVVTIDMDHLSGVLEIDPTSRAARIQAGMLGPDLEDALRPHHLTLRHFPQSFPWSTVGGWIATRAGGHYATNHTHIDDFVESTRMLTPRGWWESRRLPGSGAGPSPDRLVLGSEGTLGIITEAWLRLQERPRFRATASVLFRDWAAGAEATRQIVQAKLWPANLRLLDPLETAQSTGLAAGQSLLIVGFESARIPQGPNMASAVAIARDCGGQADDAAIRIDDGAGAATGRDGAAGAWRSHFIGVNAGLMVGLGTLADTFESAITWDRWPDFDATVRERVGRVLREVLGEGASLSCRFTHVYPDGPAPYYTFGGVTRDGSEFSQWQEIKAETMAAVIDAGGTVTHHHAVGRMHRPGWERQRPAQFGAVLRSIKQTLDPNGILNPGVLIDP
jgi:alkyldihydroxyacetonephosphate synthase